MKIASSVIIFASLFATGVVADGWDLGFPLFSSSLADTVADLETAADSLRTAFLRGRRDSYPQYQVVDNEDTFQLTLDLGTNVPDENIHVNLENNDSTLHVHGHREVQGENYRFQSSFSQRFSLDPSVQVDQMVVTRSPSDGTMVIRAPKDASKERHATREIPIQRLDSAGGSGVSQKAATGRAFLPSSASSLEKEPSAVAAAAAAAAATTREKTPDTTASTTTTTAKSSGTSEEQPEPPKKAAFVSEDKAAAAQKKLKDSFKAFSPDLL